MRSPDDLVRFLSGIYLYMMFFHFDFCRGKAVSAVHFIRKLFIAFFLKQFLQVFFRQGVFDHNNRQAIQVFFPFPLLLLRFPAEDSLRVLTGRFGTDGLRFVKEYDLSIHFHKRNL